ncbi:hypothetical protein VNO77_22577 [Canavalia gladiata]|uniref:Uncharacterized protein n=1 Tax=Canavalia gladiata TaxID=3824 RepID=A0AAN9L2U7_CANGL
MGLASRCYRAGSGDAAGSFDVSNGSNITSIEEVANATGPARALVALGSNTIVVGPIMHQTLNINNFLQ